MSNYQSGIILPISLVFLVILTLLGLASMKRSVFDQKISSNIQDKHYSFEAAELGLKHAENWLEEQDSAPIPKAQCTNFPCVLNRVTSRYPKEQNFSWWQTHANTVNIQLPELYSQPQHIIEFSQFVPDDASIGLGYNNQGTYYYRITAHSKGHTSTAATILESHMGKRY